MEYDIIYIRKAMVVYCKSCKPDPKTPLQEVCSYCILAEIHKAQKEDPDTIHEEH